MRDSIAPKLAKWPFFVGDGLMVGAMLFVYWQSPAPMTLNHLFLAAGCLCIAALVGILPFILEYRALTKVAEAGALESVVSQIGNLHTIAGQIS
ncbi:MAG TPA: hypothetical protein VN673_09900, partial [Clostridia bacterium]|nr:hypothetical protein [Clostridia bacterium]